jgi:hypothetical protein
MRVRGAGLQEHFKVSVQCYQEMLVNATRDTGDADAAAMLDSLPEGEAVVESSEEGDSTHRYGPRTGYERRGPTVLRSRTPGVATRINRFINRRAELHSRQPERSAEPSAYGQGEKGGEGIATPSTSRQSSSSSAVVSAPSDARAAASPPTTSHTMRTFGRSGEAQAEAAEEDTYGEQEAVEARGWTAEHAAIDEEVDGSRERQSSEEEGGDSADEGSEVDEGAARRRRRRLLAGGADPHRSNAPKHKCVPPGLW